jgi:hypothetical protein
MTFGQELKLMVIAIALSVAMTVGATLLAVIVIARLNYIGAL